MEKGRNANGNDFVRMERNGSFPHSAHERNITESNYLSVGGNITILPN